MAGRFFDSNNYKFGFQIHHVLPAELYSLEGGGPLALDGHLAGPRPGGRLRPPRPAARRRLAGGGRGSLRPLRGPLGRESGLSSLNRTSDSLTPAGACTWGVLPGLATARIQ